MCFQIFGVLNKDVGLDNGREGLGRKVATEEQSVPGGVPERRDVNNIITTGDLRLLSLQRR